MIKKILSLAIIAAAACGISASAQQNKMYQPQQFTDFAFEGILLDVDQQAKIDNINNAFHLNAQALPAQAAPTDKKDGDKKDLEKRGAQHKRGQMPSPANDPNMRREYANQVKQVLTPEQYTLFLENIAFMPQGPQKHQGTVHARDYKGGKAKDGKGGTKTTVKGADRKVKPAQKD